METKSREKTCTGGVLLVLLAVLKGFTVLTGRTRRVLLLRLCKRRLNAISNRVQSLFTRNFCICIYVKTSKISSVATSVTFTFSRTGQQRSKKIANGDITCEWA